MSILSDCDGMQCCVGLVPQVCCMLEVLRGAARASISMCQPTLLRLFLGLLQPLLVLHSAFKAQHPVVALLLRLADDIVAYQLDVVTPEQLQQVLGWVLLLLQQYRDSNLWQVRGRGRGACTWQGYHGGMEC